MNAAAAGRKSGVLSVESMGLAAFRKGVDVRDSSTSRCMLFGILTAAKELGVGDWAEGFCALTAVKPPALTGVKPDCIDDRGGSGGGVGTDSVCSVAFRAAEALMAGDSAALVLAIGVPCNDFFIGEWAGDGVKGPPCSNSSIC